MVICKRLTITRELVFILFVALSSLCGHIVKTDEASEEPQAGGSDDHMNMVITEVQPDLGPRPKDDAGVTFLYKIVWKGEQQLPDNLNDNVIQIATKSKERYFCVVPSDDKNELNFNTSARNSSSDSAGEAKVQTPITLLEPLFKSNSCSYKFELFWIYELCHGRYLRQYHEEHSKFKTTVTQEYFLGRQEISIEAHNKEELERTGQPRPTILVDGHHKPYVGFSMTGGTKCDLTNNYRAAKIIYVCNEEPSLKLLSIKEVSTCEYEAVVLSPHLCQLKDFKVDTTTTQEIECYSLDGAPKRPKKMEDFEPVEDEESASSVKRRNVAYLQGRTLIIDADLLLS